MPSASIKTADGLTLYTESVLPSGDPKAVVLLVHGYAEHSDRYRHVINWLVAGNYAVYTLDLRSHGKSEGQPRAYCDRIDQFVEDLQLYYTQIRAAQPSRKIFLLGHSMGALISLAFTEKYQNELDGLLISGAPIDPEAYIPSFVISLGQLLARIIPKVPFLPVNKPGILSSDPEIDIAWKEDPLTYKGLMRVRLGVAMFDTAHEVRANLAQLTLPILIMHGAEDKLVSPTGSQMTYDQVSSADKTRKIYPAMRHEIMNEIDKQTVLDDIVNWLDQHA